MRATAAALFGLVMLGACAPSPPADQEIIALHEAHAGDFDRAVAVLFAEPAITRMERKGDIWIVTPSDAPADRVTWLGEFMDRTGISVADAADPRGRRVKFVFYAAGLSISGQMKSLIYTELPPDGEVVADTDAAVAEDDRRWRLLIRPVATSWYIENSCC